MIFEVRLQQSCAQFLLVSLLAKRREQMSLRAQSCFINRVNVRRRTD